MSTTPNQKDLLAKKSDLEGILKPDDNDVLHLPGVTITLAESGQFYLAGIDKKLLTLIGNTSGNAVTLDGDAGLTFTTSGGSSTITGITSLNGNSTSLAASQSMASAKQDKIIAGTNITIAQDGKTISATDTNELENLTDVNITTPTDGQGLVYNNTTQKWENGNVSSASSIDTLTDVNLTNLTNGQILKYNSTSQEWENANESGGGGGSTITITPTLSTGTKIADYSIDGVSGELYAPNGGGGGSGDTFITYSKSVTTTQYGWWIVEDEDGNTLDPDTYVIIDISVNVRYYDVLWYQDSAGDYRATLFDINDGNTVRSSSTRTWTITYAKKDFSGGGGSSVIPNPTGTPTDTLDTVSIDGTIYNIEGSGEGGSTFEGLDYANKISLNIPDATGYTYTPTENGALLLTGYGSASVICESTSELLHLKPYDDTYSTVWVLVEKNVTYTIKKGGGSGSSFGSGSVLYFIPLKNSSSGGGGSGYTEEVIYSATPSTAAPSTLTLTKPYTDFDMLLFNLYRSADGVMNKYDRVVLTSKLSLNDRIQLITYNEWASYDITTTTSFTLINENRMYIGSVVGLKFGEGGGSGGASVIPNPTGTPTDTLDTVSINGTIYEIQGGSGGSTFETVFAGSKSTSKWAEPIIFNEFDVTTYDIIRITAALDGDSYVWLLDTNIIPIKPANTLHILGEAYCDRNNTSFEMYVSTSHNLSVSKIEGLVEGTGSSMVHYSTTEHQVGTWIDGRDVYEKVISISNISISSGSHETVDTITGLDTIISCNGYVVEGNLKYTLNDITLRVIQDGTSVKFHSPVGTTWTISSGAIIIRYTKTT